VSGPAPLDWTVYAGDSNVERFEFISDNDPWDLSDATITAQVRATAMSDDIALTATLSTPTDDAGLPLVGVADIGWDGEEIRRLLGARDTWSGVWDLQVQKQGESLPRTLLRGTFTARMDVTRIP
jgi:hypothetical protein